VKDGPLTLEGDVVVLVTHELGEGVTAVDRFEEADEHGLERGPEQGPLCELAAVAGGTLVGARLRGLMLCRIALPPIREMPLGTG